MSERYEPYRDPSRPAGAWAPDEGSVRDEPDDWRERTTPGLAAVPPRTAGPGYGAQDYASHQGYPGDPYAGDRHAGDPYAGDRYGNPYAGNPYAGEPYACEPYGADPYAGRPGAVTAPDYSGGPVAVRRPDALAGLLLVLAGLAAAASLPMHWVHGSGVTGWGLLRSAWHQFRTTPSGLADSGLWQPAAAVAGGVVLFVLGLLLFIRARTHRALGVLALLVALGAGAAVLVAFSGAGWHPGRFQLGFWFAVAVAVLGLLGAFKAMLTTPRFGGRWY